MPLPPELDPAAQAAAKKKAAQAASQRGGRMSTILTDPSSEKLGG